MFEKVIYAAQKAAGGSPRKRVTPPRWILAAAAFIVWVSFLSAFRLEFTYLIRLTPRSTATANSLTPIEARIILEGLAPALHHPLFTCPDGRNGLHVVHTRFLLGQHKVNATFIASRLFLMSTFFAPSLNAQSVATYVVVASYDSRLPLAAVEGLRAELLKLKVPVLLHGEDPSALGRAGNEATLGHRNMVPKLVRAGLVSKDHPSLDLYITSRMDADDAVHVDGVAAVQRLACAGPEKPNFALQVAYMRAGLLWQPSGDAEALHGEVARPDPEPRYLAILQSMILGKGMRNCTLDVYSHQHMQPYLLGNKTSESCPYIFRSSRNIHVWQPPAGEWGSLYVRTPTSSTHQKNKTDEEAWYPVDAETLQQSFGLDPGSVLLTNLFFSSLDKAAPELLLARSSGRWRRALLGLKDAWKR